MRALGLLSLLALSLPALAAPKLKLPDLPKVPDIELVKAPPANPDDPLPGGVFALLPANGLIGDGGSPAELVLVALDPQGQPVRGLVGTPTSTGGTCGPLRDAGNGLYRFAFTPAASDTGGAVSVELKAKVGNKGAAMKGAWTVEVAPAPKELLRLAPSPATVQMGRDTSVSLQATLETHDLMAAGTSGLELRSSAGTVGAATALGGGSFAAAWKVPVGTAPGLALVTAVDKRASDRAYAGVAIPLLGKVDATVKVAPKARVLVNAQGRTFGPVDASAAGVAKVPLELAPGAQATLVEVASDGTSQERPLDLKLPEPRRVLLFPFPGSVPADARSTLPVRAFVATPDGQPDGTAGVTFTVSAGTVSAARHEGGGVYVADFTPAESVAGGNVTLAVKIEGASSAQADTLTLRTTGARARVQALQGPPSVAKGPNQAFTVTVAAVAPSGAPVPGRAPRVTASGARVAGAAKDLRDGRYEVSLVTTGNGSVELAARMPTPTSAGPVATLVVVPASSRLGADGLSTVALAVHALDAWGAPVAGAPIELAVEGGVLDGNLPAKATTDNDGVATVYYTAGRARGYGALVARTGRLSAGVGLLQLGQDATAPKVEPPALPVAGSADAGALVEELRGTSATTRLTR